MSWEVVEMRNPQRHDWYTEEEFIALARVSERRLELWDGEIVDMTYSTPAHREIERNLFSAIDKKLKPPCRVYTSAQTIRPPKTNGVYRSPDLSIICGKPLHEDVGGLKLTTNPIVIIEITSPDSESRDRNEKRKEYLTIPSLCEYLVVAQDSAVIVRWIRQGDRWKQDGAVGIEASIELPSVNVMLSLAEIYEGVEL
jgi:Uma2 family endonuclease